MASFPEQQGRQSWHPSTHGAPLIQHHGIDPQTKGAYDPLIIRMSGTLPPGIHVYTLVAARMSADLESRSCPCIRTSEG
jgi:hypothetical protein